MRAAVCSTFGPPESLAVREVEDPTPGPDELVVAVEACAVNFTDYLLIKNEYQFTPDLPFTPGTEVAGVVVERGPGVEQPSLGQRVFAWAGSGGLAERTVVGSHSAFAIPPGIDMPSAAAFFYAYGTAHYALKHRGRLGAGDYLVVLGAAGGVGLAAVELGAAMGATVIACASSDEKLELCATSGAHMRINYRSENLKSRIRELTEGHGADVVYDAVGGEYSEPALRATAWDGRFLVVGFAAGHIPKVSLNLPLLKGCSVVGVFWGAFISRYPAIHQRNMEELIEWWQAGRISPHISATYPLERAGEAIRELADRRAMGKVVVTLV